MQVIVWLDNFNKECYGPNNLNVNKSLDSIAFALLHTMELPSFWGQPRFRDLVERVPEVAAALVMELNVVVQRTGAVCDGVHGPFVRVPHDTDAESDVVAFYVITVAPGSARGIIEAGENSGGCSN